MGSLAYNIRMIQDNLSKLSKKKEEEITDEEHRQIKDSLEYLEREQEKIISLLDRYDNIYNKGLKNIFRKGKYSKKGFQKIMQEYEKSKNARISKKSLVLIASLITSIFSFPAYSKGNIDDLFAELDAGISQSNSVVTQQYQEKQYNLNSNREIGEMQLEIAGPGKVLENVKDKLISFTIAKGKPGTTSIGNKIYVSKDVGNSMEVTSGNLRFVFPKSQLSSVNTTSISQLQNMLR